MLPVCLFECEITSAPLISSRVAHGNKVTRAQGCAAVAPAQRLGLQFYMFGSFFGDFLIFFF